jgi:hypothetical protein
MKTVKFMSVLADLILKGEKTSTWRLFDDKDLKIGDRLVFQVKETGVDFANAEIVDVKEKKLGDITEDDQKGHEPFKSHEEMVNTYKKYYGDAVTLDTLVKIINFKIII